MYPAIAKAMAMKIENSDMNETRKAIIARDHCFRFRNKNSFIWPTVHDFAILNMKLKFNWNVTTNSTWNTNLTGVVSSLKQIFGPNEELVKLGLTIHLMDYETSWKMYDYIWNSGIYQSIMANETAEQNTERIWNYICDFSQKYMTVKVCDDDHQKMVDAISKGDNFCYFKVFQTGFKGFRKGKIFESGNV